MNTKINLLIKKDEEALRREKRVKVLNILAAISLLLVGVSSVIVFLMIQLVDLKPIKTQQEDVLRKINLLSQKQAKLYILNNRVDKIEEILKDRKDLSHASGVLFSKIPSRVSVESLEINAKSLSLTVSSPSLSSIGELIDNLAGMVKEKEIINSLTINSLVFDVGSNSYNLIVKGDI